MKPSLLKNTTNLPTSVNEYLMKFLFLLSKSWHITNIAPMHQLSCVQTKRKIGSMTTSTRSLSKRHSVTSWSSYEILTLWRENNYIYTIKTGLDSLEGTEWENWTATDYCSRASVHSTTCASQTGYSNLQTSTKPLGCTPGPNMGTWLIWSLYARATYRMSRSHEQFEQQNITNNVKAVLGPKTWSHQNWFDENHESISAALDAKNKANAEWQRDQSSTSKNEKFKDLKSKVQTELRKMQDLWWQRKAALFRRLQHKTVLQCHKNRLWPIYIRVLPPVVFWRIKLDQGLGKTPLYSTGLTQLHKWLFSMSRNNQSWKDLISHQLLTKPRKQFRHEIQHSVRKRQYPSWEFQSCGPQRTSGHAWRLLQCSYCCSLREKGEQVWPCKLQGHLTPFHRGEDLCLHSPEPTDHSLRKKSPRGTVWLQTKKLQRGQDNCRQTGEGDVHCTEQGPLLVLCLYRSDKGLWYSQHGGPLEVLDLAECTSIEAILIEAQLRWVGHVIGWTTTVCPVNRCMECLRLARESKAAHASGTRTLWTGTFGGATSSPSKNWECS